MASSETKESKQRAWPGSVRWFAAEFAVVVSGILVALALQAWWGARQDRRSELNLLHEMMIDLTRDSTALANGVKADARHLLGADFVAARIDGKAPVTDTLTAAFALLGDVLTLSLHTAQYETLKSRGLSLITNDSLRAAISQFYDVTGSNLEKHNNWERVAESRWMPILLRRFHMSRKRGGPRTPRDYQALLNDADFRLFVDEYAYYMNYTGPWKQSFVISTTQLLKQVHAELKARGVSSAE